jgi:hypothetical protein
MNEPTYNIVTLKWGDRYGPEYANRLHAAVSRHLSLPFQFICFTDNPEGLIPEINTYPIPEIDIPEPQLQTGWRKLCLFQPGLPIAGPSLFLDLDIIIRGPLDPFLTYAPESIPIIHNWVSGFRRLTGRRPEIGNSSIFRFRPNKDTFVTEQFHNEKDWALANFSPPQSYLTHCIRPRMIFFPEDWTASFKRHCRPAFPLNFLTEPEEPDAPVVVFHGRPDPDEALVGFDDGKLRHRTKPATWIAKHWSSAHE